MTDDVGTELPDPDLPTVSWAREGYSAAEVDEFVGQLRRALSHEPPTMAPYEVADQRFKVSRLGRRYRLQHVDDFLDRAQRQLKERHGDDAVANLEGRAPEPRQVRTWWIYVLALLIAGAMVVFLLTQL